MIIPRKAIGREAEIGSFYNACTDNFIKDQSIYSFIIKDNNQIKTINYEKPKESFKVLNIDENIFQFFQIEPELRLSLLSGIFESNSFSKHLSILNNKINSSPNSIKFICKYEILTKETRLIGDQFRKKYSISGNFNSATHVVNRIKFGFQIYLSFDYQLDNRNNKSDLIVEIKDTMQKIFDGKKLNDQQMLLLNRIKFQFLDSYNKKLEELDVCSFIAKLNFYKKNYNLYWIRNCQIEYDLISLSHFEKAFGLKPEMTYNFDQKFLNATLEYFEKLDQINQRLSLLHNKLEAYANFFSKTDQINKHINEILISIDNFKVRLGQSIVKFRSSGINDFEETNSIFEKIERKSERFLKRNKQNEEKIGDINFFQSNHIDYLSTNQKIIKDEKIRVILCYNQNLKNDLPDTWHRNFGKFLDIKIRNPQFTYMVFDFDTTDSIKINKKIQIILMKLGSFIILPNETNAQYLNDAIDLLANEVKQNQIQPKKEINMILLGESGVGKSTFINAFHNYLKFKTLQDAKNYKDFLCLIGSKFTITDADFNTKEIIVGPTENESFIQGQSSTQKAKAYEFEINNNLVRIIDTPGMGDTRGLSIDKKNFEETIKYLSQFDHLNGICFLLKPNNARLQPGFRYCFKELLSHLHRDSIQNICFCFTSARDTMYKAGDTLPAIQNFLSDIEQISNLKIDLNPKNVFHTDNESFRYLSLLRTNNGLQMNEKVFETSWQVSSEASFKMLENIESFKPLLTNNIILLNNLRELNDKWAKPIIELIKRLLIKKFKLIDENNQKRNKFSFISKMWQFSNSHDKTIAGIDTNIDSIIESCARLSNSICFNSVALFNDEFDAHLEEQIHLELNSQIFKANQKTFENEFKNLKNSYQQLKIKLEKEENFICKDLNEIENQRNQLIDLIYSLKREFSV